MDEINFKQEQNNLKENGFTYNCTRCRNITKRINTLCTNCYVNNLCTTYNCPHPAIYHRDNNSYCSICSKLIFKLNVCTKCGNYEAYNTITIKSCKFKYCDECIKHCTKNNKCFNSYCDSKTNITHKFCHRCYSKLSEASETEKLQYDIISSSSTSSSSSSFTSLKRKECDNYDDKEHKKNNNILLKFILDYSDDINEIKQLINLITQTEDDVIDVFPNRFINFIMEYITLNLILSEQFYNKNVIELTSDEHQFMLMLKHPFIGINKIKCIDNFIKLASKLNLIKDQIGYENLKTIIMNIIYVDIC
jgi:hypothetical protein